MSNRQISGILLVVLFAELLLLFIWTRPSETELLHQLFTELLDKECALFPIAREIQAQLDAEHSLYTEIAADGKENQDVAEKIKEATQIIDQTEAHFISFTHQASQSRESIKKFRAVADQMKDEELRMTVYQLAGQMEDRYAALDQIYRSYRVLAQKQKELYALLSRTEIYFDEMEIIFAEMEAERNNFHSALKKYNQLGEKINQFLTA